MFFCKWVSRMNFFPPLILYLSWCQLCSNVHSRNAAWDEWKWYFKSNLRNQTSKYISNISWDKWLGSLWHWVIHALARFPGERSRLLLIWRSSFPGHLHKPQEDLAWDDGNIVNSIDLNIEYQKTVWGGMAKSVAHVVTWSLFQLHTLRSWVMTDPRKEGHQQTNH
jgi:hypothetical protein